MQRQVNGSFTAYDSLGNVIPEWNDLVYRGKLDEAVASLHAYSG